MTPDFYRGSRKFSMEKSLVDEGYWKGKRLRQRLTMEQSDGILPRLLRHADRNSMRWSIESRVPFLTNRLSAIGLGVPEDFLVSQSGVTKFLLREALRGLVPDEIIDRKDKVGFETPQGDWLNGLVKQNPEILDGIETISFLNPHRTRKFLQEFNPNLASQSSLMWRTYNLIRWHQLSF